MATIIRAPAVAAGSRVLRRPGVAAPSPAPPAQAVAAAQPLPLDAATAVRRRLDDEAALQRQRATALQADAAVLVQRQEQCAQEQQQLAQQQADLAARAQQLESAQRQLRDEAESIRAEAERRGYQQGLEQGELEAAITVAAQVERLNAATQSLLQARRTQLDEHRDMLVELSFAAVCRILGTHAASRAGLESMVHSLIDDQHGLDTLVLRLHPQDWRLMQDGVSAFDPRLTLQADAGIELGGCIVDGPRGTLDARLELQLKHLRETLLLVRKQQTQHEAPV